jgi:hypothetical protein
LRACFACLFGRIVRCVFQYAGWPLKSPPWGSWRPTFKIRVAELSPIFSPNSSLSPNYPFHNQTLSLKDRACRRFPQNLPLFLPLSC